MASIVVCAGRILEGDIRMRIMLMALALLTAVQTGAKAAAEDHLIPEASMFTNLFFEKTWSLMAQRLGRMSDLKAFAHAVVFPPFSQEYVIVFEEDAGKYSLVCMQLETPLFAYQMLEMIENGTFIYSDPEQKNAEITKLKRTLPENVNDVEAKITEIPLDEDLGKLLYVVWGQMLYQTRYPIPEVISPNSWPSFTPGEDGTYYHFSFFQNYTPLSGWTWGYIRGGLVDKFIDVTETANATCDSGNTDTSSFEEKVIGLAAALENQ